MGTGTGTGAGTGRPARARAEAPASAPQPQEPPASLARQIPNILTGARVALVPVFALAFPWRPALAAATFLLAAATDWADGALARRLACTSAFGKFLDPVADKLMVAAALVLLSSALPAGPVPLLSAVIICRELAVSALREWAALSGRSVAVAVSDVGKWKTAAQLASISLLLASRCAAAGGRARALGLGGEVLLGAAALLAVVSAAQYVAAFLRGEKSE